MSSNSSMALKRINRDYLEIIKEPDYDSAFMVKPVETQDFDKDGKIYSTQNMFHWTGHIKGLEGTPYHGGEFKVDIRFTTSYPLEPPAIKLMTRIYHPNIREDGIICLSILRRKPDGEWTAAWTLGKTLIAIRSLLAAPNPDDPLNTEAANLYLSDIDGFNRRASAMTHAYA